MFWSAEEYVLAVTGALFLVIVAASFFPRVELALSSRVAFGLGAVLFIGASFMLAGIETVRYPPLLWLMPVVPLIVMGVLVRDAITGRESAELARNARFAPRRGTEAPSRAAFFPPAEFHHSVGEGGDGGARVRAIDPSASAQELADIAYSHPHLRAAVAINPATPANVLEWLASLGDPIVYAAISSRTSVHS